MLNGKPSDERTDNPSNTSKQSQSPESTDLPFESALISPSDSLPENSSETILPTDPHSVTDSGDKSADTKKTTAPGKTSSNTTAPAKTGSGQKTQNKNTTAPSRTINPKLPVPDKNGIMEFEWGNNGVINVNTKGLWWGPSSNDEASLLSYFNNLEEITLHNTNGKSTFNDFSFLNYPEKIWYLCINDCKIPLSKILCMPNLVELYASNCNMNDISSIKSFNKLRGLYLSGNNISDISALKNSTHLLSLGLQNNNISDISALKNLTNVVSLILHNNKITDISYLKDCKNLKELSIYNNPLTQQQIDELQKALPNCKIQFQEPK